MGPTFTIDVPSSPPPLYVSESAGNPYGLFSGHSSESSSSIGTPDDTDDENDVVSSKRNQNKSEQEEVQNTLKGLASLDSLEDSLPIKFVSQFNLYFLSLCKKKYELFCCYSFHTLKV